MKTKVIHVYQYDSILRVTAVGRTTKLMDRDWVSAIEKPNAQT